MTKANHHSFGEFFAGIGLMRLGLEKAGWRVAFANDIDEDKQAMYHAHFGDTGEFVLGDVHQLDAASIPDMALATASFPCNDLSLAGARAGLAGAQSSAFWGFIEVLKNLGDRRPALVLLENVVGFLTSRKGDDFKQALEALNALEYTVDALIVDAARFVPQSRKRLFVVGIRRSGPTRFKARRPVQPSDCRPKNLVEFIARHPEIDWRVRPLPPLPDLSPKLIDILEEVPASSRDWWNSKRATYLLDQMSPAHRAEAEAMIQGATVTYGTVFRRVRQGKSMAELRTNEIAGCLRTPRGGSGRQILFAAGQGKFGVRLLTPRECARLMGAGDYKIEAKVTKALFGFGDAVCVPVIEWIARNYLNPVLAEEQHSGAAAS